MKKWERHFKKNNVYKRRSINKKITNKQKTFLDKLYIRIFLSSILLFLLLFSKNVLKINRINNINNHMNIFPILNLFTNIYSFDNDIMANVFTNFEYIEYKNGINYIINESFNGVSCLSTGIVVKIVKNNNLYFVTIIDENGYEYTYGDLESIDVSLYEYIGNDNIIGQSKKINNKYCFSILIRKEEENYSINNLYE